MEKHLEELCLSNPANIADESVREPQGTLLGDIFQCSDCNYRRTTPQQLRLHAFSAHREGRIARRYVGPLNSCPACQRRYPSRTQAIRHMCSSKKCASFPIYCQELPTDEVEALDEAETAVVREALASGVKDCCALKSLPTVLGPLPEAFIACYKGRPKYPLEEAVFQQYPSDHLSPCNESCVLCRGMRDYEFFNTAPVA